MELLLEAAAGLAAQRELLRGGEDVRPDPGGGLHQHARGVVRDLGDLAAHHAADAGRALGVAHHGHARVERALHVVERGHPLAVGARVRTTIRPPRTLSRSKRVQRLAGGEHHVVGDVDHVRDRALAGGGQALLEPQRRGADLHVLEHARAEAQADLGVDLHARVVLHPVVARGLGVARCPESGSSLAWLNAWTSRATP